MALTAASDAGERQFEVRLERSDFDYYSDDAFREDEIGGIPVLRVRSFSDGYGDELDRFVQTASDHRGEAAIVVDIRGNGGGNERWPISWIQRLTGRRAGAVFIVSELESKTSMMGRANLSAYALRRQPDTRIFEHQLRKFTRAAESFERGTRQPGWTGPDYPSLPLIANDTTVVLVTNDQVASAGEGMVLRLSQAENVVVVGENTHGCLTFGNISLHQLPNSKITVQLPINFNFTLDLQSREEMGLVPDLWVPAAGAVNAAVAALRAGTISTSQALPAAVLEVELKPENPGLRVRLRQLAGWLFVAVWTVGASVWSYCTRKKPWLATLVGALWLAVGGVWLGREPEKPVGLGLLLAGIVCLVWGGWGLWKRWREPVTVAEGGVEGAGGTDGQ
jgi:hypothetical protein